MTKSYMKKVLKHWMKEYKITLDDAVMIACKSHPQHKSVIIDAKTSIMTDDILNAAGL